MTLVAVAVAFVVAAAGTTCFAAQAPQQGSEQALGGSQQHMLCDKTDVSAQEPVPFQWPRSPAKPQIQKDVADCWLTMPKEQQAQRQLTWIDVRPDAQAKAQPLSGTLRIPLRELPDKRFLQSENLVLIGPGLDHQSLAQACLQLRHKGFASVSLLAGGVRAWAQAGKFVGSAAVNVDVLSPQEFLQGSLDAAVEIVTINMAAQDIASLPQKPLQQFQGDAEAVVRKIASLKPVGVADKKTQMPERYWVVVASDKKQQQALYTAWQKKRPPNSPAILWLHGGWAAYSGLIAQQHRIQSSKNQPLLKGCGAL